MEDYPQRHNRKKLFLDLFRKEGSPSEGFETQKKELSPEEIKKETDLLWARLQQEGETSHGVLHSLKRHRYIYMAAASVVLLILTYVAFLQMNTNSFVSTQTSYGETEFITLPDSSTVILNANSKLTYPDEWNHQEVREVWIEGEAFFHVQEKPDRGGIKFIVHTQGVDVEVLGTRFNVRNRRDATEVVLNSGKVKLNVEGKQEIYMAPGDQITYSVKTHNYDRKQVNPETYTSWRNHVLTFEESTLREIAAVLEDTYGFKFTFKDPSIAAKRFTTTLPADQIKTLFPMLEESFNLKIMQNDKQITVEYAP